MRLCRQLKPSIITRPQLRRACVCSGVLVVGSFGFAQTKATGPVQSSQTQPAKPVIPNTPDVVLPQAQVLPTDTQLKLGSAPITVHEAIAIALRRQSQIAKSQGSLLSAQGSVQQASAGLRPQMTATAGYFGKGAIGAGNTQGAQNLYSAGVGLSQLLMDFGRTRDQVRQERALERAAIQSIDAVNQEVALQVKLDFYALVQARANEALGEADVANRQRQLDEASAKVTSGIGAPSDIVQAKTNLANASISLIEARSATLLGRMTLALDMGIDPLTPIILVESSEPSLEGEGDLGALISKALSDRPDVKVAKTQIAAADAGLSVARKASSPTLLLTAGTSGQDASDPLKTQLGYVGLNLGWTFGDGGTRSGQIKQAKGSLQIARANLVQVSQQASNLVGSAFVDLSSAQQRVTLAKVAVANAAEFVRISEGRYDGGLGAFLDITSAQSSLVTAQRSLNQALADVQRARARLRNAVGILE